MPGIKDGLIERKELDTNVIELIKRILRLKTIHRESARRSFSQDEINYKGGAAYKALLSLFAQHLDDEKFAKHCKKFFKGEK